MTRKLLPDAFIRLHFPMIRYRQNEGDLHEGFNLGLDPTIADTLPSFQELKKQNTSQQANKKDGHHDGLEHGANLWPDEKIWNGAAEFVSLPSSCVGLVLTYCFPEERHCSVILVGHRLFVRQDWSERSLARRCSASDSGCFRFLRSLSNWTRTSSRTR